MDAAADFRGTSDPPPKSGAFSKEEAPAVAPPHCRNISVSPRQINGLARFRLYTNDPVASSNLILAS